MTSEEIVAVARILVLLSELPSWPSRITVLATAFRIGICDVNTPAHRELREAAGLVDGPIS